MKKACLFVLVILSLAWKGDEGQGKIFKFNYIAFRIDGLIISITPRYGKVYGRIDAIQVSWTMPRTDDDGRIAVIADKVQIPVEGDLRGAYFKAKSIFLDKQRELQKLFEQNFLPPARKYMKKK